MKTIGIIFGGKSVEHEISIITALQAYENIDRSKYNPVAIYMTKENKFYSSKDFENIDNYKDIETLLKKNNEKIIYKDKSTIYIIDKKKSFFRSKDQIEIDIFFPIVHGTNVEDGKLQGYLETINVPYIGTTPLSGAIGQDKGIMKDMLCANNISQTNYVVVHEYEKDKLIEKVSNLKFPVIVKPASLGSSIGIFIAKTKDELDANIASAFKYDCNVVVEEVLENFEELNISVRKNKNDILVSSIEKVAATDDMLSFSDKYLQGSKKSSSGMESLSRELPAKISSELKNEINKIAKSVYKILRCEGLIRIDIMVVDKKIYINEINNIPGSLSFYLWEDSGTKYSTLLTEIIEEGINQYYKRHKKTYSFKSNVLNKVHGKLKK